MSLQALEEEGAKLRQFLKSQKVNLENFTSEAKQLVSLARDYLKIQTYERRSVLHIDPPTSGDSSPCISDKEIGNRVSQPGLQEVTDLLEDELSLETDSNLSKLVDYKNKTVYLLAMGETTKPGQERLFTNMMSRARVKNYTFDRILNYRDPKVIMYHGRYAYILEVYIKKSECINDYLINLQTLAKVQFSLITSERKKQEFWTAVALRNLPETLSQNEIKSHIQKEVLGETQVGPVSLVRNNFCCVIRCKFLEDAEIICQRLNNYPIRNANTMEKHTLKVLKFL